MAAAAPSPLVSSVEKTNGAKLSRLLIDGGTTVLRNVFDGHYPPLNLAADLNANYLTLNNLLRRRVLRAAQWDQLFPPGGAAPDSKTYDITLLFLLLTNICGLSPPFSGWHTKPPPSDTSLAANLVRIKFFRNELYGHVSSTAVDTPTFNALWLEISAVLVALGLNQAEIDRLSDERCGEDDYLDALRDWADSDEDIKSQLKDIRQGQTETQQQVEKDSISRLEGVSQTQTTTRQAVEEVHETLQAGLQDVKQEVENLKRKNEMDRAEDLLRNLAKSEFKGDIEYHAQRFQEGTREWIFKRVDDWLDDRSSPNRVMVISGAAGMGKSVISAVICKRMENAGRLSGSHFCQHNNVRYRKPELMLQSLACHLSHALPEYKNALVEQLSRNLGPVELNSMGVEELFALLLKEPLSKISGPGRNILMVIDGLDESEYQGRNELLDVIANQFCKLPQWIRFFVTTRSEINIADSLKHLQPIKLEENQEENLRDIELFFEMQLIHKLEEGHKEVLLQKLVKKSEGVILYAYFLIDFIKNNFSLLTEEQLESSLPLGISSVYLSHFKRLENELCKELKIEEDQMLSFLCALTASREPLPVAFVSRLLNLSGRPFSVQRRINKAIACISSLLPVRDDCLHFFHKSVKDWLTNISCYGQHDFTVDEKEGHEILFSLCWNELDNIKRKGVHDTQFSDIERYALQHGVQHMIEIDELDERSNSFNVEELVNMYVTDLELIYAKLRVKSTAPTEDIFSVQKLRNCKAALLSEHSYSLLISLLKLLRKNSYLLRDHPHLWFQSVINEGPPELSSRAAAILENRLPSVPYMKYLNDEERKGAVQARFYCSDTVACFDVSPEMDYMVCECRDDTIHMWSLETGNMEWIRPSLMKRTYVGVNRYSYDNCGFDRGAHRVIDNDVFTYYRSVVFHPSGKYVLPGNLRSVYTLKGDCNVLLPDSNCFFSHCAFPSDKRTILTDSFDDPKTVVLWSMENGKELKIIAWDDVITSFAISQDGSQIAFCDVNRSIYLVDVDRWHGQCLLKCKYAACGLMHFTPDNEALVCGNFHYSSDQEGWTSETDIKPSFLLFQFKTCQLTEGDFILWPIEPTTLAGKDVLVEGLPSSCLDNVHSVFPSLETGFYRKLNKEITLVGSPSFKYVATVNADLLNEVPSDFTRQMVKEVLFSYEGDAIYSISSDEYEYSASEVLVTVIRMSTHEILGEKSFTCPSLSLVPMKEGVVICLKGHEPELWDFELTDCIRPITRQTGTKKLIRLSDELIACLSPCRTLTPDELRSNVLDFGQSSEEADSIELTGNDSAELGDSSEFDDLSNDDDTSVLGDSSFSEISFDFNTFVAFLNCLYLSTIFEGYRMLAVDIINVSSGECISTVKTKVRYENIYEIMFFSCNSQNQLLVCTREEIENYFGEEELTVSLRNNNVLKRVWQRSTKRYEEAILFTPGFLFSPEEDFVVTWNTFDSCYGIHMLDAQTGETCNTLLKDHKGIIDCKFVANSETLVCCSRDNFLRLLNIRSGDLLSVLDIEVRPYCVGACLGKSLVAIGLSGSRLKFIHVELSRVKDAEKKKGSIIKQK
ncbi:hypothetical protein ACROYT_G030982 [Oculina patagonica]